MIQYKKIDSATSLPNDWDSLAVSYFQRKEFLIHCEKYNPCKQRYYLFSDENKTITGAIVYTLALDIFTFIGIPSPIKMKITGIPCSVSAQGIIGDTQYFKDLILFIQKNEKGFQLTLNIEEHIKIDNTIIGRTLPTITLKNTFNDWNHYKDSMRSDYRRRFLKIKKSFGGISQQRGTCNGFTDEMHTLYLEVLKRSKGRLETLNKDFFQNLPSAFCLTSYYASNKLIGWYISATCLPEYYFFLGGIDYKENKKYQTYLNMIADIIKEGILKKAEFIDLGQTAEIAKMRFGGEIFEKYMIGFHSWKLLNAILKKSGKMLEYKTILTPANTLKK